MGLKVNKFSSRILKVHQHSLWEGIAVMLFFMAILIGLINLGYQASSGAVVFLFSAAAIVVAIVIVIDLYRIISSLWSKK